MKNLLISIKITLAFCVILSLGYVLVLWAVAGLTQPNAGRAEALTLGGKVVGAAKVGQQFTKAQYFWPRPSAAAYNGSSSSGSNKGVTNTEYLAEISARIDSFLMAHPYLDRSDVPSEMVTASASGLDPHISVASARAQAQRVAEARKVSTNRIIQLITTHTTTPLFGVPVVNVLKINIALDEWQEQ